MPTEYREVRITLPQGSLDLKPGDTVHLCSIPAGAEIVKVPSQADVIEAAKFGTPLMIAYWLETELPITISVELGNNEEPTED